MNAQMAKYMKTPLAFVCAILLMGNIFFCACFLRERASRSRLETDLVTKSSESNHRQRVLETVQKSHDELRKNLEAAASSQDISGIYVYEPGSARGGGEFDLDLRSDGTALFKIPYSETYSHISWKQSGNSIAVQTFGNFHVEGQDLIDPTGNRWIKVRNNAITIR